MLRSLFIIAFVCSSCASRTSDRGPREHSFFDALFNNSYTDVFDAHTQRQSVLSEFEPVMTVHATNWDQSMRNAYVAEMARQYRYSAEREKVLGETELKEDENYFVFILSASTREPEWNDFERQSSMWRITLENQDGSIQLDPERIETVSHKDERAKAFYQHMSQFTRTYRVRFLKKDLRNITPIKLHISGTRGYVTFTW